jgi:hypothetical protein
MAEFDAFEREDVKEPKYLIREYRFYLGQLAKEVGIRIWKTREPGRIYRFTQSHYLHTPTQIDPYRTSVDYGDTEEEAVTRALRTFTTHYREALGQGYKPQDAWLVENEQY